MPTRARFILCLSILLGVSPVLADEPAHATGGSLPPAPAPPPSTAPKLAVAMAPAAPPSDPVSAAEQVARLEKAIAAAREHVEQLKAERDDPGSEYAQAQTAFEKEETSLQEARKALKALAPDAPDRPAATTRVAEQETSWKLAKDRFDLAIEERKTAAEQVVTLEQKILRDAEALDKLEGRAPAATPATAAPIVIAAPGAPAVVAPPGTPVAPATTAPATDPAAPEAPAATTPAATTPAAVPGSPAAPAVIVAVPGEGEKAPSKEMIAAKADAETKSAASKEAEKEAKTVSDRLGDLDKDIGLEQKLVTNAKKRRENASAAGRAATDEFRARSLEGAPRAALNALLAEARQAEARLKAATEEVQEHTGRLDEIQTERAGLLAEQVDAMKKASEARAEVKVAEEEIRRLSNPFSPINVLRWLAQHGPPMLLIFGAMVGGHWLSRIFSRRVIHLVSHDGARGGGVEREARTRTLVGVFHNAASVTIFIGGGLMVLQEAGIPIAPLLGGAAVFGLAVAFGAQNLIRDYFYGFVILLENQYKLNDVIKIGELSGQVEKITLRMTVLRDLEGRVHFVPNGQVTAVTNLTHGWSRALFDIGVAYKEDVDRVMAVLATLCVEIARDPQFAPLILEGATMLGVDALGDSAVVIKFYIKTRPLQQWAVKRELLRRIKNKFDELNIEIPYPHRMVYYRADAGVNALPMPETRSLLIGDLARRPSA